MLCRYGKCGFVSTESWSDINKSQDFVLDYLIFIGQCILVEKYVKLHIYINKIMGIGRLKSVSFSRAEFVTNWNHLDFNTVQMLQLVFTSCIIRTVNNIMYVTFVCTHNVVLVFLLHLISRSNSSPLYEKNFCKKIFGPRKKQSVNFSTSNAHHEMKMSTSKRFIIYF